MRSTLGGRLLLFEWLGQGKLRRRARVPKLIFAQGRNLSFAYSLAAARGRICRRIFFDQNRDQVGNRALGEGLSTLNNTEKLRQAMALVLLTPHIPMLFMGEEAAAETPFLFFCDWQGEVAQLTRDGRRKEFAEFQAFSTPEMRAKIPDPTNEATFLASKIDWDVINHAPRSRIFRAHAGVAVGTPPASGATLQGGFCSRLRRVFGRSWKSVNIIWETQEGNRLQIVTSFADTSAPMPVIDGEVVWSLEHGPLTPSLRPHQIVVAIGEGR